MKPNKEKLRDAISGLWHNALWLEDTCIRLQDLLDPKGPTMMKPITEEEYGYTVNKWTPKLITGGKEPPDTTGDTWLEKLPVGTCFYVAKRAINPTDFTLALFRIAGRTERTTILQTPDHQGNLPVKPVNFCNMFTLWENLGELGTEEELNESNRIEGDTGESED